MLRFDLIFVKLKTNEITTVQIRFKKHGGY